MTTTRGAVVSSRLLLDLAQPALVLPADTACDEVLPIFGGAEPVSCVVIREPGPYGRLGVLSRAPFAAAMVGRLGFGRTLHGRRPVSVLTDWQPLLLPRDTGVESAAEQVLARVVDGQYPDVLVEDETCRLQTVASTTLLRALVEEYGHQARYDALTGLPNRTRFLAALEDACEDAEPGTLAVFFADLDDFKTVNDTLGHGAGDRLLREVADRLLATARPSDLVARLAGDEFTLLVRNTGGGSTSELAGRIAERIIATVGQPVSVGSTLHPRLSLGVAVSGGAVDAATLLREADQAMYRAKQAGGNQAVVVDGVTDVLGDSVRERLVIDDTLSNALSAGQFRVHYQPIVALADSRPVAVEALVRWEHPIRGLLAPDAFLPQAEASGFIADLSYWVLAQAARQLAAWDAGPLAGSRLTVNVNLCRRQLADPELAGSVLAILRDAGLEPSRVTLELPEGATREELTAAAGPLEQLRSRGVRLTLDDIGTGASTLHHLSALPIDGLKIDRAFVAGIPESSSDLAVIQLLTQLGGALGLRVTAEGVETEAQRRCLLETGCDRVQGFLLSRPVPAADAVGWLADRIGLRQGVTSVTG